MKRILILPLAALLAVSCDKPEEKTSSSVAPPPKDEKRLRPTTSQPGTAAAPAPAAAPAKPALPPPTPEEIAAVQKDMEEIAKAVDALSKAPADAGSGEEMERIEKEYRLVNQRRAVLLAGRSIEAKKDMQKQFGPLMARISGPLTQMKIARTAALSASRREAALARKAAAGGDAAPAEGAKSPVPPAADAPPPADAPPAAPVPAAPGAPEAPQPEPEPPPADDTGR
jgi:hypothetical protein